MIFYRRGREGERRDDVGEMRDRDLSIFDPCQFSVQDCSICYNKQQLRNSGEEGGGVLLSCSRGERREEGGVVSTPLSASFDCSSAFNSCISCNKQALKGERSQVREEAREHLMVLG